MVGLGITQEIILILPTVFKKRFRSTDRFIFTPPYLFIIYYFENYKTATNGNDFYQLMTKKQSISTTSPVGGQPPSSLFPQTRRPRLVWLSTLFLLIMPINCYFLFQMELVRYTFPTWVVPLSNVIFILLLSMRWTV